MPAIEQVVKNFGKINLLMVLENSIKDFSAGAWMQDAKLSLKNFGKWHRVAFVSHEKVVENLSFVFSYITPAAVKGFSTDELNEAKQWVAAN